MNSITQDNITLFQGVNVDHVFTEPKRIAENAENGCIVRTGQFAFNKVMKAHNTKLPFALREGPDCVVSSSYQVFKIVDTCKLLPKYLLIWMNRSETQRYAGFVSFGTTRDIFSFDDMKEISIPIPDIKLQQCIVDIFSVSSEEAPMPERIAAGLQAALVQAEAEGQPVVEIVEAAAHGAEITAELNGEELTITAHEPEKMEAAFNVTGERRKALVEAIKAFLDAPAVYQNAPSFAYVIGDYTVSKTGTVSGPANEALMAALNANGFIVD